ncbi:ribosomal protein S18-alanine N-acetyltransferase [Pelobacter seleniigenes]|uniref:ribosomal protein S18-alanine N-acetyltransferase n=1 Tax=Pelobacter seleniigenes TaxID=407188 RepID=UPI00138E04DB|nr:ribosomal protein S18-alanine N-acetyltransferase [Pelobacter seleniigenes]
MRNPLQEKNILIREATTADLDAIVAIEQDCYAQPWTEQMLYQELLNPVATFLCLAICGRICAYLCYWLVAGEVQILNLATATAWQRRGFAGRLLSAAFKRCAASATTAWLEVRAGNQPAINLYQGCGFASAGVRRGYYRDGEDAVIMVKELSVQEKNLEK